VENASDLEAVIGVIRLNILINTGDGDCCGDTDSRWLAWSGSSLNCNSHDLACGVNMQLIPVY
jgi:hypothetical protein